VFLGGRRVMIDATGAEVEKVKHLQCSEPGKDPKGKYHPFGKKPTRGLAVRPTLRVLSRGGEKGERRPGGGRAREGGNIQDGQGAETDELREQGVNVFPVFNWIPRSKGDERVKSEKNVAKARI